MTQTLEQKRAKYALEQVMKHKKNNVATAAKYMSFVKGFSAMVLHNGLGQSTAFLLSKDEEKKNTEHYLLMQDVEKWLKINEVFKDAKDSDTLISCIVNYDRDSYVRATEETLLLVDWLAKFANAFIEGEGN